MNSEEIGCISWRRDGWRVRMRDDLRQQKTRGLAVLLSLSFCVAVRCGVMCLRCCRCGFLSSFISFLRNKDLAMADDCCCYCSCCKPPMLLRQSHRFHLSQPSFSLSTTFPFMGRSCRSSSSSSSSSCVMVSWQRWCGSFEDCEKRVLLDGVCGFTISSSLLGFYFLGFLGIRGFR